MTIHTTQTIREIAVELPGATQIFEKLGIDYCCGGATPLKEACLSAGVSEETVVALLNQAEKSSHNGTEEKNWQTAALSELMVYIVEKHHALVREEFLRLRQLLGKVCSVHSANHPELFRIRDVFLGLQSELMDHMSKEEQILFPYFEQLEEAAGRGEHTPTPFPCGALRNPIYFMMQEHDNAGEALRRLREYSANYTVPDDACISFRTLYQALEDFEKDLHQHIHLENNILFPRAAELEASV